MRTENESSSYIGLLDGNNFFVSCERLFRPDLADRPVIVLSSNDGCVIARSQEIKDSGIPMGVPYFQIKDTLSDMGAAVFSSHFTLYRDISRRLFNALGALVPTLEQYSIDEAFFSYQGDDPAGFAADCKRQLERAIGVPVSIGLAPTKTQAKWVNSLAKKTIGVAVTTAASFRAEASDVPLRELWGVGAGRSRAFTAHQLHTVADLLAADRARVARLFGIEGVRLQHELAGQSAWPVRAYRAPQQSVMHSQSFARSTTRYADVADAVAYHVRQAGADLRQQGQQTATVRVAIRPSRHGDWALRAAAKTATLTVPTNDTYTLLRVANDLLAAIWQPNVPYQKAGVVCADLTASAYAHESLFATEASTRTAAVVSVVDALNQRYGTETVRLGAVTASSTWRAKRDWLSPAYTTRWSDIAAARA